MVGESPSGRQGEARREEILACAVDVFGEMGFAGARIDEVARRVGIRRPSVLYHYSDKAQLYGAALATVVGDIAGRFAVAAKLPQERLAAIMDAWVDFMIERPNAARLMLRRMIDVEPIGVPRIEAPLESVLAEIQTALDEQTTEPGAKPLDAAEFSLVLGSASLVWVASGAAVEGALGLDTLSPAAIARHRRTLHALTRQLVAANREAAIEPATRTNGEDG